MANQVVPAAQLRGIAEHPYNDHAIRSEKRPAPVRRPCGGRALARIAVSKKIQTESK